MSADKVSSIRATADAEIACREAVGAKKAPAARTSDDHRSHEVVLLNGADVVPAAIDWLWKQWLARGKLHILAGAPGQGKTTIALAVMAALSSGGRWPDGTRCEKGIVLMWSGEDDPADTLTPRLIAMGADMSRVFFVQGTRLDGEIMPFDPARDMAVLAEAANKIGNIKLLVVDPVVSAVAGDSHKNTEVRRALQPLVDLGASLGCAVLGISHFAKGGAGKDPTERVVGSVAFSAVARVVMCAAKVKGDDGEDRRVLVRSKSNIGPDDGGFEYGLEQIELDAHPGIFASCVTWGKAVEGSARELLAEVEAEDGDSGPADAATWLRDFLANGAAPAREVKRCADDAGFAWRTVQRAMRRAGVSSRRPGFSQPAEWFISDSRATVAPVAPTFKTGANGATGGANGAGGHELGGRVEAGEPENSPADELLDTPRDDTGEDF